MPGKIKVKILAGRNLPVMDRSGDTTDAYVELKFGTITYKTDVCRKSLNPQWNSEWYRFEVDDAELQDEPLQIRLMDHDTYSANDAIGKVYVNLNPLLLPGMLPPVKNIWTLEASMNTSAGSQGSVMTGWIPVYDTMHGIRGEVNIIIKVELFSDFNKFRQSSCGVQFFYSPNIPYGYHAQMIHGFVEELVVSDDPEYKWIDKIRTPRASNEARQTLFFKLSGEVQRKIGLKALDLGGNAVIGYLQNFDLEGESGIVARGIGTAVTLVKLHDVLGFPCDNINIEEIAFALSSCTKAQTGRLDADGSTPFIPISIPASYPVRIPMNRSLPSCARSLSSLTRPERATRISEAPGCTGARRKRGKRIPFFRCNTLSTLNLRIGISGGSDLAPSTELNRNLIDETAKSVRTTLTAENATVRKKPSRDQLSKQIKHLRSKFDSVGEENHQQSDRDSDADLARSFTMNSKREKNRNETKTSIMAALLIGSIRHMPLENVGNDNSSFPINEQLITTNNDEESGTYCRENSQENADVKDEGQRQDNTSSIDETEISSFDDNDNSSDDELSNSTASYNILDDSRYSLDSGKAADSSSLQERIPITVRSSAESCTDSTLQIDSDVAMNCQLSSNPDLASTEDIGLRNDAIPVITVDIHENANSDTSIELSNDESSNITTLAKTDIFDPKAIPSLDERQIDDARCKVDTSEKFESKKIDNLLHEARHVVYLMTKHERDLGQSHPYGQSAQLESSSPVETENRISIDRERNNPAIDLSPVTDLPRTTTRRASVSKEELRARTIVAERRRCMRDLIKLIDTKMMVSTCAIRHGKRIVSLRSKRKKRERKMHKRVAYMSENSLEKIPSHGTLTRKHATSRRRRREEDVPLRIPRVRSIPDYLSSDRQPNISIFHAISRSCGSSLVNLIDHRVTRVSRGLKRVALLCPAVSNDLPEISRKLPNSSHGKSDTVSAVSVNGNTRKRTICNLEKASYHIDRIKPTNTANITHNSCVSRPSPDLRQQDEASISPSCPLPAVSSMTVKMSQSPATRTLANVPLHRRSSDSDLSVTPKGNSLGSSDRSMAGPLRTPAAMVRSMNQDTLEMLEYPFITMQYYPPGFILHIGGLVSSRSVKLIERISNLEEPEGRDAWWTEIRMEVRSHARALACNVVIGYKEETSICDDVCVLSASGTAAVINFHNSGQDPDGVVLNKLQQSVPAAAVDSDREKGQQKSTGVTKTTEKVDCDVAAVTHSERLNGKLHRRFSESTNTSNEHEGSYSQSQLRCNLCHLPYSESSVPFRVNVSKCAICKRAKVPDVMFTTIEVPANIPTTGRGCFIQATVCKNKKDLRGELNAKEISDCLPFLEYELHSLLLNKLKIKGMNAIFGLKLQVCVGERFIIGMAVGTAIYLTALPLPTIPQIASGNSWHNEEQLAEMQKSILETVKKNREFYRLKPIGVNEVENGRVPSTSDTDESDEDLPELDLGLGTRDACVLEVDDIEDMDRISSLMDNRPPDDFHVVNTQTIPGLEDLEIVRNLQMFTQVSRAKIPTGQFASMPSKYFARLLQSLYFKLRRMVPCALCDMQFKVALPEQDEIQLTVVGMALGLGEPLNMNKYKRKIIYRSQSKDQVRKSDDSDMIFSLDEDHLENNAISDNATRTCIGNPTILSAAPVQKPRPRSPLRLKSFTHRRKHVPLKGRYGVDITPLSYLPGGRIERYQGNLNFFFIRESTSIRENGGLSGFTHSFMMEVLAIVRAHITALGGNAMVAFFMTQCVLLHSPHKNQGQCLINVGGDVVTVSYYADEKHSTISNC
ncbi:C2 domain-containing protein 5 isoform X1 [Formica exsecta]|uniref:C2 domain-containing protein 5 isoform X1 n=1 Tax=Formica exsecta TaxID=72781 RepID=UPI0011434DD0|nr:C2 domain-containing protein 5 isoform X1 [Formica exsecta]XP_029678998.1 C2 domain-containing protein 5 isoform X1 [Formica exsecta]XP_029678999.1 C2 domain-containing protein 5 isoform X1 [Formica exsecta]